MGKGSTQVLIRRIIESVSKFPMSATEIAKSTDLDRTAISRYLDVLKKSGFVKEQQTGTSKKYFLSSNYDLNTYFGLPLDEKTTRLIDSLYFKIKEEWGKKTERKLLKTTAQKIMFKVIEESKLNIPKGWYIYGGICIKPYDYNESYEYLINLDNNVLKNIKYVVEGYSVNHFEYESRQMQYKDAGNDLYDNKEDILKLLYSKNFSKNSIYIFQKLFSKLWNLAPKGDELYDNLLNDYDTLLIDITKHWDEFVEEDNERNFAEFKQKLILSFETLWKMVAMYNFKNNLEEFYLEKQLDEHFKFDLFKVKEELIEIGSELNDMIPFEEPDDPTYLKIREIMSNITPLTKEESEKVAEEMEEYKKKHGQDALNKKLRKEFGLD
ncbi:hypothetical protein C0585_03830 [Candidatus Woesearchaeota archaeon]|nr:MAG: hypothetical protein C0585_03830 [Candidatus Woesearchaeota archaeon]